MPSRFILHQNNWACIFYIINQILYIIKKMNCNKNKNEFFCVKFHCGTQLESNYNILELWLFSLLRSKKWLLLFCWLFKVGNRIDWSLLVCMHFTFQSTPA